MAKKLKVKAIYDNGGKTADRYTVYYNAIEKKEGKNIFYACLGMDDKPFHPQGIGLHSSGVLGRHNGKRIQIDQLPLDCQKAITQDLGSLQ
jgi:hypothetical protein